MNDAVSEMRALKDGADGHILNHSEYEKSFNCCWDDESSGNDMKGWHTKKSLKRRGLAYGLNSN